MTDGGGPTAGPSEAPEPICTPGEARACYEGPEQTEGVGVCTAGQQQCAEDGLAWLPCEGQVVPAPETCGNDVDESCDGQVTCGETIFSRRIGVPRDEAITGIASDADGAIYVTGFYRDPIDLGAGELPVTNSSRDVLLAKLDPAGEALWSFGLVGNAHLAPGNVAVGPSGEVAIAATISGNVSAFGSFPLASSGGSDAAVLVVESDGAPRFAISGGGSENDRATDVAIAPDGTVVVAGTFRQEIELGGASLKSAGVDDGFVAALAPDGSARWLARVGGDHVQELTALALDPAAERILVAGVERDEGQRLLVAALSFEGEELWRSTFDSTGQIRCRSLAVDSRGYAVVTGSFAGELELGDGPLDANAGRAIFVASIAPDGSAAWAKRFGGAADNDATSVAIADRDRIVLAGYYEDTADFGGGALPFGGVREPNILLAKLESTGEHVWSRGFRVSGDQTAGGIDRGWRRIAISGDGTIVLGGFVRGALDLGDGETTSDTAADLLIARFEP